MTRYACLLSGLFYITSTQIFFIRHFYACFATLLNIGLFSLFSFILTLLFYVLFLWPRAVVPELQSQNIITAHSVREGFWQGCVCPRRQVSHLALITDFVRGNMSGGGANVLSSQQLRQICRFAPPATWCAGNNKKNVELGIRNIYMILATRQSLLRASLNTYSWCDQLRKRNMICQRHAS